MILGLAMQKHANIDVTSRLQRCRSPSAGLSGLSEISIRHRACFRVYACVASQAVDASLYQKGNSLPMALHIVVRNPHFVVSCETKWIEVVNQSVGVTYLPGYEILATLLTVAFVQALGI